MHSFNELNDLLDNLPFIVIIGKYDHILGPRAIFSPIKIVDDQFIRNLLRDALNTKNKFVILNYDDFYSQVCKVDVKDETARGKKQLYAIILLRHVDYPLIPTVYFQRIEMIFRKLGEKKILIDDESIFNKFAEEIQNIYLEKNEIIPLESANLEIRSEINTIRGFCELILEEKDKSGKLSDDLVIRYVEIILDSCDDIIETIEKNMHNQLQGN
ncbi:MAG: hypothetical protein JXA99_06335 [Candidatus Lokiarchaeota archaeon]|nr:hypothetical protein [Candidatus Lokiarchaeota archaeon]